MQGKHIRLPLLAVLLSLAACASFEERLAGWEQDSRTAGRPVLVYGVESSAPTAGLALANTGTKAVTGLSVTLRPYAKGSPAGNAQAFDLSSALSAGGIAPGAAFNARWNTDLRSVDCFRVSGLALSFADGSNASIGEKDMDDYFAPVVNKHCTRAAAYAAPSGGY